MKKKQFLTTALAGLLAINTLASCTNKTNTSATSSSSSSVVSEINESTPKVEIIEAPDTIEGCEIDGMEIKKCNLIVSSINSKYKDENYNDFITIGEKAYKIEIQAIYQYPATKIQLENGIILYVAEYGGVLSGTQVFLEKTSGVSEENAMQFLLNYGYIDSSEYYDYYREISKLQKNNLKSN